MPWKNHFRKKPRVSTEKSANHSIDINFSEFSNMIINGEEKRFYYTGKVLLDLQKNFDSLGHEIPKARMVFPNRG